MIVYKYLNPKRIDDVLSNGLIRFTQPAALNDPYEGKADIREIRRYFSEQTENANRGMGIIEASLESFKTQQLITMTFGRWQADNHGGWAILSLSKNCDNLLMWSHYCESHRGFVVGFDSSDPFFSVPRPGAKSVLQQVTYSSHRPVMPAPGELG
jgi:hypothetical protein